ncbi:hypothetical protein WICPIJ_000724 [Wickerhamomyces pijperi]|uniref:Uncharacterized protein n=1 Tax=Wickerhamomyces pijperi TaxID=599730 RepID=A0A9P8TRJ5_WICPI|nr:hypothetical protein WICPIJ_000724 [Wickerhamomyces pijperi]
MAPGGDNSLGGLEETNSVPLEPSEIPSVTVFNKESEPATGEPAAASPEKEYLALLVMDGEPVSGPVGRTTLSWAIEVILFLKVELSTPKACGTTSSPSKVTVWP